MPVYLPKHFEESDLATLHALMRAHPLASWVTLGEGALVANHIPFVLDATRGEFGTLSGHVARVNPVWKTCSTALDSLLIFQGADAYVTPSWYPSKREHGEAVPTWNYAVVHASGMPRVIHERDWLLRHLTEVTDIHEAGEAAPWRLADAPAAYIDTLMGGVVGIEIPLVALSGKWKVSQNRASADQRGVVAGLLARGDEKSADMAAWVSQHIRTETG